MSPLDWYTGSILTPSCISLMALLAHAAWCLYLQVLRQTPLTSLCQHC